jgi:hypothetical protein
LPVTNTFTCVTISIGRTTASCLGDAGAAGEAPVAADPAESWAPLSNVTGRKSALEVFGDDDDNDVGSQLKS